MRTNPFCYHILYFIYRFAIQIFANSGKLIAEILANFIKFTEFTEFSPLKVCLFSQFSFWGPLAITAPTKNNNTTDQAVKIMTEIL